MPLLRPALVLLLAAVLLLPGTSGAAESRLGAFNRAVTEAYAPYRAAMFYLRTGNPFLAAIELENAASTWTQKVMPFSKEIPDAFLEDAAFAATLEDAGQRLDKALTLSRDGDPKAASEEIRPIREALSDLRARNGLTSYSDLVDRANAATDAIWVYRHKMPDLKDAAARDEIRIKTAYLQRAYEACNEAAPEAVAKDPEFRRLIDVTLESLAKMWPAIERHDSVTIINILREIRSSDRILWLRFG